MVGSFGTLLQKYAVAQSQYFDMHAGSMAMSGIHRKLLDSLAGNHYEQEALTLAHSAVHRVQHNTT